MPVYSGPLHQRVQPAADKVGAVVVFKTGASDEEVSRVQAYLDRLAERGIIEPTMARAYQSKYGQPVWYIP